MDVRMLGSAEVLRGRSATSPASGRRTGAGAPVVSCSTRRVPLLRLVGGNPVRSAGRTSRSPRLQEYLPGHDPRRRCSAASLIVPLARRRPVAAHAVPAERDPGHVRRRRRPRHRQRRGHQDAQPLPRVQDVPRPMGGTPRRAILFEGPPGTGKTYMAKAMAREAGVPFLFVSASAFQSMYYGQTNRKIRSFFKELRKTARREGGAIGFIEEIDAIAGARSGDEPRDAARRRRRARRRRARTSREGISGVVNELLVQMQSFDEPTIGGRIRGWGIDRVNRFLPAGAPDPEAAADRLEHPRDRRDEPRRRPRPRAAAPGSVRPVDLLRPPGPRRAGARSSTTTWTRRRTSPSSTRTSGATSSRR